MRLRQVTIFCLLLLWLAVPARAVSLPDGKHLWLYSMVDTKGHKFELEAKLQQDGGLVVIWELPQREMVISYSYQLFAQLTGLQKLHPKLEIVTVYRPWNRKLLTTTELRYIARIKELTQSNVPVLIDQEHLFSSQVANLRTATFILVSASEQAIHVFEGVSDFYPEILAAKLERILLQKPPPYLAKAPIRSFLPPIN